MKIRFGCTAILCIALASGSLIAQDEIPFGTLERLNEQNILLEIQLKRENLTPDSFVAELNGENLEKAVEIMARAAGTDGPRPDGTDGPRPDGTDGPRPDGTDGPRPDGTDGPRPDGTDGPRPDGIDAVTGTLKVIVVESTIGRNTAYLRGFRNAKVEGNIVRIPFVRTFKRVDGVWKISAWLESKL